MAQRKYVTTGECVNCSYYGTIALHHIKSRGAGGSDHVENLMPLCGKCHDYIHKTSTRNLAKNPSVESWLILNGWEFDEYSGKYLNLNS